MIRPLIASTENNVRFPELPKYMLFSRTVKAVVHDENAHQVTRVPLSKSALAFLVTPRQTVDDGVQGILTRPVTNNFKYLK